MNVKWKAVFALFASFVTLGGAAATLASPAGADSPDCTAACSFHFTQPQTFATASHEVGLQFQSDIPGWIAAICFWEGPGETGSHTVTLWDGSGANVATATALGSPGPESCVDFSPPVAVSGATTYTASYTANTAYLVDPSQFGTPYNPPGHLRAPADAGVLGTAGSFPTTTSIQGDGYGVDVAFVSTLDTLPADCASTLTAPTTPTSAPGNASAVVSWGPATSDPPGCIAGYLITPFLDGAAQSPTLVTGTGTTTIVKGLTNGQSYTFTVTAESGRIVGPASDATAPVTVGTPSAPTVVGVARVPRAPYASRSGLTAPTARPSRATPRRADPHRG